LVMQANKEIRSKIFKADENLQPPLLQLAHQYMIKGDEIDRQTEEVLSARACASMVLFERESERLLKEGKRMTAEKDAEIIKLVNSLQNVDDCIKICMG